MRLSDVLFWSGQAVLISLLLFVYLRGWDRDFSVPLRFARDSLSAGMLSKSTLDHGWWWFNPSIGAPFGLDERQYPASPNVDQAIVWTVGRFAGDPVLAQNLAWLAMVVLSGLSATWCMRFVGASKPTAAVAGTLFALTPYALYRSTGHFWLVIYLVPFACTAALQLASGRLGRWYWGRSALGVVAGCALLAFNYAYYAFFACFVLIAASVIGYLQHRARAALAAGALVVAIIVGGTVLNLVPTMQSWAALGQPLLVPEKTAAESELYGLKIRHLVSPGLWHRFPPFRVWLDRETAAGFPLETENGSSRLGLVATLGFLGLLGALFVPRVVQGIDSGEMLLAAGRLSLGALLLGTVGGFGSVFNLLVSPEIRAYNRISPFIAFFALTAVALALDTIKPWRRRMAAVLVVALVGLADQRAAAVHLNAVHQEVVAEFSSLTGLVRGVESRLPQGAMVFQLPLRMYPHDDGGPRAQPYENLKPYLASRTLRWSYPALSNQQVRWQQAAALLDVTELVRELSSAGFAAVLVDRTGYVDMGTQIVADLEQAIGPGARLGETPRYVVFDLRHLAAAAAPAAFLASAGRAAPATEGLKPCTGHTFADINRIGTAVGSFATSPLTVEASGDLKVSGWAVDSNAETTGRAVDVVFDGMPFQTIYGTDRPDVVRSLERSTYLQSGFIGTVPASRLTPGEHALALGVVAADGLCYYQTNPLTLTVR